jgi:hypothetical protein
MNLEKEEDHHHHHHRENVSENISIGREEKRERDTRASFAIEKGLVRPTTTTTTHESSKIAREREKIFEFFAQQRREEVSATKCEMV